MKTVNIVKAQPIGEELIEGVEIRITNQIATGNKTLDEVKRVHQDEAQKLFDALFGALPGGVFDKLAGLMLQKIGSQLVITKKAFDRPEKE